MTLTRDTLRTPLEPGSYPAHVREDITHMDYSQLEMFVRGLILGERPKDLDFLPEHFWMEHADVHPSVEVSVSRYLIGIRNKIPSAIDGKFTDHDGRKLDFDPSYQTRIEQILMKLADECLYHKGELTHKELALAQVVIDSALRSERTSKIYEAAIKIASDKRYSGLTDANNVE